jgi:hypothetical protein
MSTLYHGRGLVIFEAVAFPERFAGRIRYQLIEGRPALVVPKSESVVIRLPSVPELHDGGEQPIVWLDGGVRRRERNAYLYIDSGGASQLVELPALSS